MTSRTLIRRRLHHGDVDGRRQEHYHTSDMNGLDEPLLLNYDTNLHDTHSKVLEGVFVGGKTRESLHWNFLFSQLVAQWSQWFAHIVLRSRSVIERFLPSPSIIGNGSLKRMLASPLTPLQEERLENLRQRLEIPFDGSSVEHQDALRQLWRLAYPDRKLPSLRTLLWKEMGWQGSDPSTDFRGGGFISLENLIYFAIKYQESFQRLLHKRDGTRAEWEYPFAVAGINISFMLVQMLSLQSGKPSSLAGTKFVELLKKDEMAFDDLFCIAFQMMDARWLAMRATYMEFNVVLKSTITQLEQELQLEDVSSVRDLPAYIMLRS